MIIHKPKIKKTGDKICFSAKIKIESLDNAPNNLWFEINNKDNNIEISTKTDAFVSSLFLLAMRLNENIEVRGGLSKELLEGINKYQKIFHSWFPSSYTVIKVNSPDLKPNKNNGNGVLSTFTGGVDSFYTLWSNIPKNQIDKAKQITHCLFVHGFDTDISDTETYLTAQKPFKKMLEEINIKLFSVKTNVREFTDRKITWDFAHGSCITATALIFEPIISSFYIASSYTHNQLHPWGSHPKTDPLLSTKTLKIIHHGTNKTRIEKIFAISKWDKTYNNLRVCSWLQKNGLNNCCRCSKCIRTMIALDIAGTLKKYKTFPLPITRKIIRKSLFVYEGGQIFIHEIIKQAKKERRFDIVFDLRFALLRSWVPLIIVKIFGKIKIGKKILRSELIKKFYLKIIK